jgi:virulence factor Mce-like protein
MGGGMTSALDRRNRTKHAVLGGFAMLLFVSSIGLTYFFLKGGLVGGVSVDAVFSSAGVGQLLPIGGDVKVRGVLVGRIQGIDLLDGERAVVHMRLEDQYDFPRDTEAEIRSKTVFGQKWIELIPPQESDEARLVSGDQIPDSATTEPLELESSLQLGHELLTAIPLEDLSSVLRALAEGFSGQEKDARIATDKGLIALRAINSRSDEFDLSLRQLREFADWARDNDDDLLSFMSALDTANRALVGAAPEFRSSMQSVPVFLNDLAAWQELTEEDLGRLVDEGASIAEVVAARSDNLNDIVVELEPFTTVWNSGLSQPCGGLYERNMTCWQVYQLPGLDDRGLYGNTAGPASDEPGDPLLGASGGRTKAAYVKLMTRFVAEGAPVDLARVLHQIGLSNGYFEEASR